ncbi:MAG: NERD domain-containing protein [Nitrospira sp.]|nr:NERD domain-containing protein [Nitrospira sp.]
MAEPAWNVDLGRPQPSFKVPPLLLPGQSIDEQINALQDKIGELFLAPFLFVAVSCYGWIQWWIGRPADPLVLNIVAIITILYAMTRISSVRATIRNLQLGRDGERLVGQMLEQLRVKGYRVFHGIPGPSFNIDHAIVGPAGIFTIETKSRTKPLAGSSKVLYDGKTLQIAGKQALSQPLRQARAQARWLTA